MTQRQKSSNVTKTIVLSLILLMAAAAVVVFQTDPLGWRKRARYDDKLLQSVKVTGTIKVRDLNLSGKEITTLNRLAAQYAHLFDSVNINLILPDQFAPIVIKEKTTMLLTLKCYAEGAEVEFWSRKVVRSDLVNHMTRCMKKAADEFQHYIGKSGENSGAKHLFL